MYSLSFSLLFSLCLLIQGVAPAETNLVVYAQPTDIASWLDHTGVYTAKGEKYVFTCTGNMPIPDKIRYSMSAIGDLNKSITLSSGNYDAKRENNIFDTSEDTSGILYGVQGVCHQMTNRIMYSAGATVDPSQLYGGSLSHTLYGVYGHGWNDWLSKCEKQWGNKTSEYYKTTILSKAKGIAKSYLRIDLSDMSEDTKIMKRIDLLLHHNYNFRKVIDKNILYKAVKDFVNNVHQRNDVKYVENEFQKVNKQFHDVLGDDGYRTVFGMDYDIEKLTFKWK